MYTEEEHKQLFKRFFGKDSKLYNYNSSSIFYMVNKYSNFRWVKPDDWVFMRYGGNKPYTTIMNDLYGKDVKVCVHDDMENPVVIHYHVPSSFEEMSIICDLNGK